MAVRSKRLYSGGALAIGSTLLYTVPAGKTALIKRAVVTNAHATSEGVISLRLGGAGAGFSHSREWLTALQALDLDCWWVLPPLTPVYAEVTGPSTAIRAFLYGAELEGVAA